MRWLAVVWNYYRTEIRGKKIEFVLCILGIVVLGYIAGWENISFEIAP